MTWLLIPDRACSLERLGRDVARDGRLAPGLMGQGGKAEGYGARPR